MDRQELKAVALKERVANLAARYEDEIAEYRVELHMKTEELAKAFQRIQELEKSLQPTEVAEDVSVEEASDSE